MQSTWGESWKSSEIMTTKIAFTSRSVAALRENDLANCRPPMPSFTTTLGGTTAAVCSRCRSQRNLRIRHGQVDAGEISAGLAETVNEADPDRVRALHEDDRDCLRRRFGRELSVVRSIDNIQKAWGRHAYRRWPNAILILCAFVRRAPSVRLNSPEIFLTGNFSREYCFKDRRSSFVHSFRLRFVFLAIITP
jgi:hypothetical protein